MSDFEPEPPDPPDRPDPPEPTPRRVRCLNCGHAFMTDDLDCPFCRSEHDA